VIPFRRFNALALVVTRVHRRALDHAHRVGDGDWRPNGLWFSPLIETLIAVSILYMALENIAGVTSVQRRWMIAFGFGLVHGFGFSFALRETLQFAGSHLLTSLLAFNVGVELGQLLVLAVLVPVVHLTFRYVVAERMGTVILSAFVAHTAWHWTTERWERLRQYDWPAPDLLTLLWGARALLIVVAVAALVWLVAVNYRRSTRGIRLGRVLRPDVVSEQAGSSDPAWR
jgi:hypothetical protein